MDAAEMLKCYRKICHVTNVCNNCILHKEDILCEDRLMKYPEEFVSIIQDWRNENGGIKLD